MMIIMIVIVIWLMSLLITRKPTIRIHNNNNNTHVCIYVCMYVCMYIYIYIYTYTYTHTHIRRHNYDSRGNPKCGWLRSFCCSKGLIPCPPHSLSFSLFSLSGRPGSRLPRRCQLGTFPEWAPGGKWLVNHIVEPQQTGGMSKWFLLFFSWLRVVPLCSFCQIIHNSDGTPVEPANPRVLWAKGADMWWRPGVGTWGENLGEYLGGFLVKFWRPQTL